MKVSELYRPTAKLGMRSFVEIDGDVYMIVQVAPYEVNAVSLSSGNRFTDNVRVRNLEQFTESEAMNLFGDNYNRAEIVSPEEAAKFIAG